MIKLKFLMKLLILKI